MKSPTICCPRCEGTGKVQLTQALNDTLSVMGIHWMTTKEIYEALDLGDFKITAINNRLTKLLSTGLIAVKVDGKVNSWSLK